GRIRYFRRRKISETTPAWLRSHGQYESLRRWRHAPPHSGDHPGLVLGSWRRDEVVLHANRGTNATRYFDYGHRKIHTRYVRSSNPRCLGRDLAGLAVR